MKLHDITPEEAMQLIQSVLSDADNSDADYERVTQFRDWLTARVAEKLKNNWRFSSDYRHGVTQLHEFLYSLLYTVGANNRADDLLGKKRLELPK